MRTPQRCCNESSIHEPTELLPRIADGGRRWCLTGSLYVFLNFGAQVRIAIMNVAMDLNADGNASGGHAPLDPVQGDHEGATQAIVFLGRLLGTPIQKIQLQEGLSLSLRDGWSLEALMNAVHHAGPSAALLPAQA